MAAVRQICEGLAAWASSQGKPKRQVAASQSPEQSVPAPGDEVVDQLQGIYERGLSAFLSGRQLPQPACL